VPLTHDHGLRINLLVGSDFELEYYLRRNNQEPRSRERIDTAIGFDSATN
jgi:hypothetical protein